MKKTIYLASEDETRALGFELGRNILPGMTIYLTGTLGTGKTTFTRGFLEGRGYTGKVKSPTYALVEPYDVANKMIFHFDFYRINHINELSTMGLADYFSSEAICLVEWPEKAAGLLPSPDLICQFDLTLPGRTVEITAVSEKGNRILTRPSLRA